MLLMPMMPAYLEQLNTIMHATLADATPAEEDANVASKSNGQHGHRSTPMSAKAHRRARLVRQMEALRVYHIALSTCSSYIFRHGHLFNQTSSAILTPAAATTTAPLTLPRLATSYETLSAEFGPALLAQSRPARAYYEARSLRSVHGSFL